MASEVKSITTVKREDLNNENWADTIDQAQVQKRGETGGSKPENRPVVAHVFRLNVGTLNVELL